MSIKFWHEKILIFVEPDQGSMSELVPVLFSVFDLPYFNSSPKTLFISSQESPKVDQRPSYEPCFRPLFLYIRIRLRILCVSFWAFFSRSWFRSSNGLKCIYLAGCHANKYQWGYRKVKYKNMHKDWLGYDWFPGAWTLYDFNFLILRFQLSSDTL